MESRYIALIFAPTGLQQQLFSHYHAGPSGGHMGEYKTLYCLRSGVFLAENDRRHKTMGRKMRTLRSLTHMA